MSIFGNNKNLSQEEIDALKEQEFSKTQNLTVKSDDGVGDIQVSANALASIIRKEVEKNSDITRFAPAGLVDGIADVFSNRNYDSSIGIDLKENGMEVSLSLVLRYGCNIRSVVGNVQKAVKDALENMAGANVLKVNVIVKDLEDVASDDNSENDK